MKHRSVNTFALALVLVLVVLTACKKDQANINDRKNDTSSSATPNTDESSTATVSGGPTETFKNMIEATRNKDAEGVKKSFSKGTIAAMEKVAQTQNKTLDEVIKADMEKPDRDNRMPETRNEKINGDNATVDVKDFKTGQWGTFSFVKEDGEWKIALDKMMEQAMKQMNDAMSDTTKK